MPGLPETDAGGDFRGGLPAGIKLSGYELKSILGQGAFGITYRARDPKRDCDVAIKEYLPATLALREGRTTVTPRSGELAEQFAWGRERFLEEANTLKRLEHAHSIVSVLDFLEDNGTAYMVMTLVEGETLAKRLLREQRLTSEAVERLLFPLLDGLEQVHAIGFLHRDIKPANIMIGRQGEPTLIDFGASRAAVAERSTTITAVFTPGYAAVEQFTSTNLGPWSDIYGLAATLYHAITGRIPPSALHRMLKDEYEPLTDIQPAGYSRTMLGAIDAAMAVPSDDRPRSIAEWRGMLRSSSSPSTRVIQPPGRLARVVRKSRRARLNIGAPTIALSGAVAVALLAGAGYLAFTAYSPPTVSTAALNLSAEQLEQALTERRKADALVAEKRRVEEEARQKAEREADAKRQAEAALEEARQARQKAEQELADMKARATAVAAQEPTRDQGTAVARREVEVAAERKAEADAAALRQAEEDARKKLEADAEAKRQADEALAKAEAERQRADEEARAKAAAEQAALRQASEEAQRKAAEAESVKQAEAARARAQEERRRAEAEREKAVAEAKARADAEMAERALGLDQVARQHLQVALTSLGFDTRGSDGVFGPRSREMIASWQQKTGAPATSFLTASQRDQIMRSAAAAVARWDEQKKIEEEKAKAEAPKLTIATPSGGTPSSGQSSPPIAGQPAGAAYDGTYSASNIFVVGAPSRASVLLQVTNGHGSGTITQPGCDPSRFSVSIRATSLVSGEGYLNCVLISTPGTVPAGPLKIDGTVRERNLVLSFRTAIRSFDLTLRPGGPASPALASPDGLWRGTYTCKPEYAGSGEFTLDLALRIENGISSGGGFIPDSGNGRTLELHVGVAADKVTVTRSVVMSATTRNVIGGTFEGNSMRASGQEQRTGSGYLYCTLTLTRA